MRVLDLFSGIGGFSLGLERAGMTTVAFCEIDPFCRRVLNKHWPNVPVYDDVRALRADQFPGIDVICGGFPCQDISDAGACAGIDGERSGLWREYARLIRDIRPRFAIVENVNALRWRGLGRVLGDLAECGYDAEWRVLRGVDVGLPFLGKRVWIVATPSGSGWQGCLQYLGALGFEGTPPAERRNKAAAARYSLERHCLGVRADDGLSVEMERRRIRALGNAVTPQIPELIGRAILHAEQSLRDAT